MAKNKSEGFTVVGVYDGKTEDRYAGHFDTKTAEEAEEAAIAKAEVQGTELVVAGVFAGKLKALL
jgi:hypothetical protein